MRSRVHVVHISAHGSVLRNWGGPDQRTVKQCKQYKQFMQYKQYQMYLRVYFMLPETGQMRKSCG